MPGVTCAASAGGAVNTSSFIAGSATSATALPAATTPPGVTCTLPTMPATGLVMRTRPLASGAPLAAAWACAAAAWACAASERAREASSSWRATTPWSTSALSRP
ncbi:hypothetical protein G6F55_014206 [Rhizopus delemar]|nr:hypothetical protein G6F23_013595 [Rhizopus arrhizus]KAG1436491.1 hypothetical protein G6F55_014206 [Rhizopus delemar]